MGPDDQNEQHTSEEEDNDDEGEDEERKRKKKSSQKLKKIELFLMMKNWKKKAPHSTKHSMRRDLTKNLYNVREKESPLMLQCLAPIMLTVALSFLNS